MYLKDIKNAKSKKKLKLFFEIPDFTKLIGQNQAIIPKIPTKEEELLINQLMQIGFTNYDLNMLMLRKHNNNIEAAADEIMQNQNKYPNLE